MLLRDDALANQIRQTVTTTTSNVDEIVAGLKAGRGPAGMLLRDEAVAGQIRRSSRTRSRRRPTSVMRPIRPMP